MILVIIRVKSGYLIGYVHFCALGIVYTLAYFYIFFQWHGPEIENNLHAVEVIIERIDNDQNRQFINAQLLTVSDYKVPRHQRVGVSFVATSQTDIQVGDVLVFETRLRKKHWRVNFNVRDPRLYGFKQNLIYVASPPKSLLQVQRSSQEIAVSYRQWLDEKLANFYLMGVYKALLSAQRQDMNAQHLRLFQTTGTIHLLAISGLHIALLYGMCFVIIKVVLVSINSLGLVKLNQAMQFNSSISMMALLLCAGFVWLCGFPVSAQRAWFMIGVVSLLYFSKQQYNPLSSLAVALACVLAANPFALLDLGLWFSFAAVSTIYMALVYSRGRSIISRYLVVQLSLYVLLMPLTVSMFGGASWASPLFNIVMIPFISFVVLPLLLFNVVTGFSALGVTLLTTVDYLLGAVIQALLPFTEQFWINAGYLQPWVVVVTYVVVIASVLLRSHWPLLYGSCSMLIYSVSHTVTAPLWRVDILDVGHGLSVVISVDSQAIVYDLGPSYFNQYSIVKNTLLPHIKARGLHIEHTIISHEDNDHRGGLAHWLEAGYSNTMTGFHADHATMCNSGPKYWQGLTVDVLWPLVEQWSTNASSCVVRIFDGQYSLLLTGDISAREEQALMAKGLVTPVDVLVSPHHGSITSSSDAFVSASQPRHVIHSSATRRGWQMPHPDVSARYDAIGAKQWLTKHQGGIKVLFYHDRIVVSAAKGQKKYWFITD